MTTTRLSLRLLRSPFRTTAIPSVTQRTFTTTRTRLSAPETSSAYKDGFARYKLFVSPFAKVFLGAIFTYQVLHWTWLKLEMDDSKYEKNKEVAALEQKARELTGTQKKV
ncbi:uncharacterized protein BO97DRAFT_400104 [Aspergillus homomorphus CBS 101889]|uniref:Uncharacterized protein n=1 Tax=Aspergillus homomorphus (strain CBS 101889) TaxID=1450537 RepID=A0A395HI14_ASPHC|nr:hypothetical protein BO97DRAFT_400104 [Aspergillus homomorphus CBS 101889]RAL07447.1 hypothetical protein BO97DRAFT_400104 [Aspergillus homomorphus CBS 101889]